MSYSIDNIFDSKTDYVIIMFVRPKFDASSAEFQRSESSIAAKAGDLLDEASAEVKAAHPGIQVESMLGEGDPRDVICNRASEDFVDFIIVGSQGKTALTKAMMGSVSQHLLHNAPCPVLVYPSSGTDAVKRSTSAWGGALKMLKGVASSVSSVTSSVASVSLGPGSSKGQ
ncbi:hypothetical protein CLOM_g14948 [Closterium sp. NIES-68]|nr:hypothetical protein CLOM_g14948 [Closterium sp. NIES-68]GJP70090.1 hypothetical protein CLOP_g1075 [Closterium sp. NIES-67]